MVCTCAGPKFNIIQYEPRILFQNKPDSQSHYQVGQHIVAAISDAILLAPWYFQGKS